MSPPSNLADCQRELEHTKQQLEIQTNLNNALHKEISELDTALKMKDGQLHHDTRRLSQELEDSRNQEQLSLLHELAQVRFHFYNGGERAYLYRLIEQLELQLEAELSQTQKWKDEAHGQGSRAVRRCWQASVDEAVRKQREDDRWLRRNLCEEIDMLKAELAVEKARRGIGGEVVDIRNSPLVKSLQGEIRILRAGYMPPEYTRPRTPW